jgi:hypothetical protein
LTGRWRIYLGTSLLYYYFYTNGRFQFFESATDARKVEGKYSVSNGKLYLKEMKQYNIDSNAKKDNLFKFWEDMPKWKFGKDFTFVKDKTMKFELGSDNEGKYLQSPDPWYFHDFYKFRKKD